MARTLRALALLSLFLRFDEEVLNMFTATALCSPNQEAFVNVDSLARLCLLSLSFA